MFHCKIDMLASIKTVIGFWPALVKEIQVVVVQPLERVRPELAPGTMQPAAPGSFAEKPREKVKRERDSPERLRPEVPAWRSAQPARVFAAPVRQRLIPLKEQSGYERCLCSCRSNRRW